jgi:hypothetical protein
VQIGSRKRFQDAIEADALDELVRKTEKLSLEKQLERYPHDFDLISGYSPGTD